MEPNINWKNAIILITIINIIIIGFMLLSGCSFLQMSPADKITSLPTTPQQQLFQTLAKTNWLLTLTIVGVGAGFFAFLNGSSKGLQFMAACFVVICLIIGITRYSAWIAAIAMIGTVYLMVYSVLVKRKALREVIQGVQLSRTDPQISVIDKPRIDKNMRVSQSKTTKAIVKAVKDTL